MAILLVKIEDKRTLPFNEFFDYCGYCYASTRSRQNPDTEIIDMTSFYEAAINTEAMLDVPVVFVSVEENHATILGWYKKADILNQMYTPSLFLEGNIKAYSSDVVWLPEGEQTGKVRWFDHNHLYEVIEEEDARYIVLEKRIREYQGDNQMIRYHNAKPHTVPKAMQDVKILKEACERWATIVAEEECQDIRDLKTLEVYAKRLTEKEMKNPDGYYYQALASYHLGFAKDGLKQINKALKLEPEASDLIALKGLLLVSRGYVEDGAAHLQKAFEMSQYEVYLLMEGQAFMRAGKVGQAYDCFKQIEDESLLEENGIHMNEMENKWNFIKVRYMKLREMIWRK